MIPTPTPPAAPVTLWQEDLGSGDDHERYFYEYKPSIGDDIDEGSTLTELKALPAADFDALRVSRDALVARVAVLEGVVEAARVVIDEADDEGKSPPSLDSLRRLDEKIAKYDAALSAPASEGGG